ncbi:MAG: aspartate--tRNA ligase, partial [Eubacteriales bacterium]|nr:aspartate--tRNA ligase [Eubacteriales bacterium]
HSNIVLRSKVIASLRRRMTELGFMEIQTPILTSSSPEGARDYLVPSRVHPGKFYALPQAPQQFKQLLMTSGFDRYFQIAPCFRDEDARADRSPGEFYQLDMEMAFATQEDVFAIMEKVLHDVFVEFSDQKVTDVPFPRIPFKEAILSYGSDKPDLRNPLIIKDLTPVFVNTEFNAFKDKTIRAIPFADGDKQGRKFFDRMGEFAVKKGAKGLAWVKIDENGEYSGSISKFLTDEDKKAINEICGMDKCYAIFFAADEEAAAAKMAGLVRSEVGAQLDLLEKDVFKFCWIVDFPMFEYDEDLEKVEFSHNPFSMPQGGMDALSNMNPLDILAYQYDIVCNGIELSSGAVRNHNPEMMVKAFEIAGYDESVVRNKFPALYNAFHYGAPPHAGIAPGVDRIVMLLADEPNIREVIAFPMNKNAQDLLMGAPAVVTQKQLDEVHIKDLEVPEEKEETEE